MPKKNNIEHTLHFKFPVVLNIILLMHKFGVIEHLFLIKYLITN